MAQIIWHDEKKRGAAIPEEGAALVVGGAAAPLADGRRVILDKKILHEERQAAAEPPAAPEAAGIAGRIGAAGSPDAAPAVPAAEGAAVPAASAAPAAPSAAADDDAAAAGTAAGEAASGSVAAPAADAADISAASEPEALSDEAVLAHTAALWQYKPVPADEPDAAPEYKCGEERVGNASFIAARVRGKKHKHEGTNCDDWFAMAHLEDIAVMAVSDGAGSKRYSRVGAKAASEAAVGCIYERLRRLAEEHPDDRAACGLPLAEAPFNDACGRLVAILHEGVQEARRAIEAAFYMRSGRPAYKEPLGRELVLADFAATLLVTLVVPIPETGEQLVVSCQIGDGMTAALNTQLPYKEATKFLGQPDSGDFSGETDFLTSPAMAELANLQKRTLVSRRKNDVILMMTDGVSDDYFSEQGMCLLWLDLVANGILAPQGDRAKVFTREEVELLRALPKPQAFPCVGDKEKSVALQYAARLAQAMQCSQEELWHKTHLLALAAEDTSLKEIGTRAEKLQAWLDNRLERGSFDDRTLVILSFGDDGAA